MKKTPLKRKSSQNITQIQNKIWEQCKRIIRIRYPHICYTCGKTGLSGSNLHTGHLYAKASLGAFLKYDLRVLRPQCYNCNINLGGNGAEYYRLMVEREGQDYVDKIIQDKNVSVKASDHYIKILMEYRAVEN